MRAVLVTGATGTVGGEVLRALATHGELAPIAALRPGSRSRVGVEARPFDLTDEASMRAAFVGVAAFFFMTPLIEEQVSLSRRALDIALAAGVQQVVRLSSRSATWDLESELRAWHREIDADVAARAPRYTVLRPCSFMQNFLTHQAEGIRAHGRIALPIGDARLPYIDARDIADVAVAALLDPDAHHGKTYTLTGGEAIDMHRVAQALGDARGAPVRYIAVNPEKAAAGMRASDMPSWLVDSALRVHERTRAGLEAEVSDDVARVLGRAPRTIEDYARDHQAQLR
ncbi:MAG: NmrA family NAD(P)-binding protein [Polyangiales bacterium]